MKSRVRTCAVIVHNNRLLTIRSEDPTSGREYFFLPGGKIGDHEAAPDAAERGTFEKTGLQVRVEPKANVDREYLFHWRGEDLDCLTIFYSATLMLDGPSNFNDIATNRDVHWIPISEVSSALNYSTEILSAVEEILALGNSPPARGIKLLR